MLLSKLVISNVSNNKQEKCLKDNKNQQNNKFILQLAHPKRQNKKRCIFNQLNKFLLIQLFMHWV
jgi:hypothetical protein